MTYLQVAIGIIVGGGHILVTRRPPGSTFQGLWEFPGGKIEPDESATECLHRELLEELGITVEVLARLAPFTHEYEAFKVTLHPFIVKVEHGTLDSADPDRRRWVSMSEIVELEFPAANGPLLRQLQPVLRSLALV